MACDFSFERRETLGNFDVIPREIPHSGECADDEDTHLDRSRAAQHRSGHDGTMLGEGPGKCRGVLEVPEVVTVCDNLIPLLPRQLKSEVRWEPFFVPLDGLD